MSKIEDGKPVGNQVENQPNIDPEPASLKDRVMEAGSALKERTGNATAAAREGLQSGAGKVADASRAAASVTRETAGRVAEIIREAEPDEELKATVRQKTEHSIDLAGEKVSQAAPAVGRGAEMAARLVGGALNSVAHPIAIVLGAIAGTLGGWWNKAAEGASDFPESEEQACRAHFTSITILPQGMTFERARTGYVLGYVASRNPGYRGRGFDEIEPDLQHGFGSEGPTSYQELRDYARFGYERGSVGGR